MFERLRQTILMVNAAAEKRGNETLGRKAVVMAAQLLRKPKEIAANIKGFTEIVEIHDAETRTWIKPEELKDGGAFDACDLRHWLVLAELAGVPFVPAREILALEPHEMEKLSGQVKLPDNSAMRSVRKNAHLLEPHLKGQSEVPVAIDFEELVERLHSAMDDVPEGFMVRFARCGSSELKALAGAGAAGPQVPEVRFDPGLEVGPGWIRNGNRRRVHVSDSRTVEMAAQGPVVPSVFLARPWMEAARYAVGDDPHRHGSVFAGKGAWPAEWRAFVEDGVVVGVSSYYGWCGSVTPENAEMAVKVRELAQQVADKATELGAWPRFMDVEFVRMNKHPRIIENEDVQQVLDLLGRQKVACTLDFIETKEGLMLLEGGPANTPFGGGHPCAFAGAGGPPVFGKKTPTEGVAFRTMPHVLLGDPSTWTEGDRANCILSWDEVSELAASFDSLGLDLFG